MQENDDSDEELSIHSDESENASASSKKELKTDLLPEAPDVTVPKKRVKRPRLFQEEDLCGPYGIKYVYRNFPSFMTKNLDEGESLDHLINNYMDWAFRLHPGLSFPDLLARIETFGTKGTVKSLLLSMRDEERTKYIVSN
jgi:hypothetical protein